MIFLQHLKWFKYIPQGLSECTKTVTTSIYKLSIKFKVIVRCLKGRHILEAD